MRKTDAALKTLNKWFFTSGALLKRQVGLVRSAIWLFRKQNILYPCALVYLIILSLLLIELAVMAKKENRIALKRLRSAYLSSVISTALVLFLLGVTGLFVLNAKRISDYYRQGVGLSVYLVSNAREADVARFQKQLDASDYVRETVFKSKEEAAKEMEEELGQDFVTLLSYNPLPDLIEVRMMPEYATSDSIEAIQKQLEMDPLVEQAEYQKNLLDLVNHNIERLSVIMLLFSGLLLFVSIVLINNTIRLSIYAKRFIINTMKLIGATRGFISRPFLSKSLLQGFFSGVVAVLLMCGIMYLLYSELGEDVLRFAEPNTLLVVFAAVVVLGMLITLAATFLSVRRYIRLGSDDLYY